MTGCALRSFAVPKWPTESSWTAADYDGSVVWCHVGSGPGPMSRSSTWRVALGGFVPRGSRRATIPSRQTAWTTPGSSWAFAERRSSRISQQGVPQGEVGIDHAADAEFRLKAAPGSGAHSCPQGGVRSQHAEAAQACPRIRGGKEKTGDAVVDDFP